MPLVLKSPQNHGFYQIQRAGTTLPVTTTSSDINSPTAATTAATTAAAAAATATDTAAFCLLLLVPGRHCRRRLLLGPQPLR